MSFGSWCDTCPKTIDKLGLVEVIIVRVIGGLGNQMFQLALGRALAEKYGVDLLLDTSLYEGYSPHNGYELERVFGVDASIAGQSDLKKMLGWRKTKLGSRLILKEWLNFLKGRKYYSADNLPADFADCYVVGFWQSEKYFNGYEKLVRNQFRFDSLLVGVNKSIELAILNGDQAVSLHVRRGDYVSNQRANEFHGVCDMDYYGRAMAHIEKNVTNPIYYIFSDDSDWVKQNLKIRGEHHFVDNNSGLDSHIDMRLMSICKHHIIANSTFSWWGAWLNGSQEKIVIAPAKWFVNLKRPTTDLLPPSWIRI